uniref:Lipocalin n=1 Tax=Rhipicephalus zambeziensis TaxID=60191 RepID=A0A224YNF4_9ACAR
MFVFILPFLVDLASAGSSQPDPPYGYGNATWDDLLSALSTQEEIWLTKSKLTQGERQCIYWLNNGITGNNYSFDVWSRKKEQMQKIPHVAELTNETERPAMKIRYATETPKSAELFELKYWSEQEKCFILTSTAGACEQHVWKPHIDQMSSCDDAYAQCSDFTYPVYSDTCINPKPVCVGAQSNCVPKYG